MFKWIKKEANLIDEPRISSEIKNIEFDEMWHFIQKKPRDGSSNHGYSGHYIHEDRDARRTIAWVIGNRDAKTFRRLYNKVKHLTLLAKGTLLL